MLQDKGWSSSLVARNTLCHCLKTAKFNIAVAVFLERTIHSLPHHEKKQADVMVFFALFPPILININNKQKYSMYTSIQYKL